MRRGSNHCQLQTYISTVINVSKNTLRIILYTVCIPGIDSKSRRVDHRFFTFFTYQPNHTATTTADVFLSWYLITWKRLHHLWSSHWCQSNVEHPFWSQDVLASHTKKMKKKFLKRVLNNAAVSPLFLGFHVIEWWAIMRIRFPKLSRPSKQSEILARRTRTIVWLYGSTN